EYLKKKEELKTYDINMFLLEADRLKEQIRDVEAKDNLTKAQMGEANRLYEDTKQEYESIEEQVDTMDASIETYNRKLTETSMLKQQLENQIALLKEQIHSARMNDEHYANRAQSIERELSEREEQLGTLISDQTRLQAELDSGRKAETLEKENLNKLQIRIASLSSDIEKNQNDIREILGNRASTKAQIQKFDTMMEQIQVRKSGLNQRYFGAQSEAGFQKEQYETFYAELKEVSDQIISFAEEKKNYESQIQELQKSLNEKNEQIRASQSAYHREHSRLESLRNMTERYDGYGNSIKRVMDNRSHEKGLLGVVADIIKVEKKYETAIETALGGSIQNIVTDNEQTAKRMIEFLKKNKFGRATFLPLTQIRSHGGIAQPQALNEEGVIGLADTLVMVEDKYLELAGSLLGRTLVVDHIDHALALAKKYRYSLRIVTLEGESLNPGGSLSGGAYKNTGNLLGRHREMEELQKHVETLRKEGASLKQQINQLQSDKDSNKAAMEKNTAEESRLTLHQNTVRLRLKQVDESRGEHAKSIQDINRETAQIKTQQEQIRQFRQQLTVQMDELEAKKKNAEELVTSLTAKLEEISEQEKDFNSQTADMRIHYANQVQKKSFIRKSMDQNRSEIRHLQEKLADYRAQKAVFGSEKDAIRKQIDETEAQIAALTEEMTKSQAVLRQKTDERSKYAAEHKTFFAKREELSETISQLDKEQFRLGSQKEKLEESRSQLSSYMWEEYGLTYQTARELSDDALQALPLAKLKKMTADVKGQIKALGNVNVNAIEEYKAVAERYETMKTQHDDMVEAEEKLVGIIEDLNSSMQKQFKEKFMQIQKEFDRIFKLLFGGGKGTLELADPENLLETGVIITAQPPGKKLQNMMQLSGGEKALTAIALLFAIQSLKPSPFCLLDEIEAALDDANVKRFAEYLHNLTKDTQFIVITHRRGTMNTADILYGITMQEKGVSTLVSVNLIENELGK
ncbi:MAG: chromosome segregation protein SMC, partial [Coprococcus catus]|nr:chromosome segregation protein SMC [Coprococcus catus]